jgi:hypothetical protein
VREVAAFDGGSDVNASVAIKWLLPDRAGEADSDRALVLLWAVRAGTVELIQPPHWLAEATAVLARLSPDNPLPPPTIRAVV